jgi:photosystem II stability/assembly factor-like uncharacterized protein
MMVFRFFMSLTLMTAYSISAGASDVYFIVANSDLGSLEGFTGRYWGRTDSEVFLTGNISQKDWLDRRNIEFDLEPFDLEYSSLYLWNVDGNAITSNASDVVYRGADFLVSSSAPPGDIPFRRLNHHRMPVVADATGSGSVLTYHPLIDEMIGEVEQDTVMDCLARLSGALPIEIDGEQDTIFTRYSGTPDNYLAARYIREVLENYGYEAEFHGFYGGAIRHMASYDENLAWIVTENSEAMRTVDGGENWTLMPDGTDNSLWGVANYGQDLIWITGNSGTIRFSDDGGNSFSNQNSGVGYFLFGVKFIDESEGWIVGDNGIVLHTVDGGQDWSTQSTPTGSRLYDVCFIDSENGWACGRNGTVIHTTDGGESWSTQNANTGERLYGIDFIDSDNGWVVGWSGVVRRTTDGGDTWQTVNVGSWVEKYDVQFTDESFGCIVGWDGEIFITTDGGDNWEQRSSGTQSDFYGVTFVDNQIGYAGGNSVLLKTTDGGETWFSQVQNIDAAWQNVIATKYGTVDPDQQVVICGHMDDRSEISEDYAPGADDNGSGTVAVIEAARIFAPHNFEKTIKFCLWTGEEQGLLGSAAYAEEAYARGDDIIGVYNFDMIAWDGNSDGSVEFHTGTSNPSIELGNALLEVVGDYSIELNADIITWGATGASDHASFWDYGYAAMLGIEDYSSDFNPYYHTTGDNIDHIMEDYFTEYTKTAVGGTATLAIPDTGITLVDDRRNLPDGFALRANYPNPFNAATIIEFITPVETDIDLAVYDILGRRVSTLYEGSVKAGAHRVAWNAVDQPSGVYFYRLTFGNQSTTGRMTLLK